MGQLIIIWEAPRFRGTALAFALANGLSASGSVALLDEPLHWRRFLPESLPDEADRLDALAKDVVQRAADYILVKMQAKQAFAMEPPSDFANHPLMVDAKHIVLVRETSGALISHRKALARMTDISTELTREGSGFPQLHALFDALAAANRDLIVADTDDIAAEPETTLRQLSDRIAIPFSPRMVRWSCVTLSPPPWGGHWYEELLASTGWAAPKPPTQEDRAMVSALHDELAPLVNAMKAGAQLRKRLL